MAAAQRLPCPIFEGKSYNPAAAKAFLEEYEAYCTAYALDDDSRLVTWSAALKDKAREWLLHHKQTSEEVTWENTLAAFKLHFTAPIPRANRATMTSDVKQKPGEDVRSFAVRCSNLAFDTLIPPDVTEFPILEREYTPQAAAGAAAPAPVDITVTLNEKDVKAITRIFAMERAINIFVAGLHDSIKGPLVIDQSWETWDDMLSAAKTIEQNVRPQAIQKQLQQYAGISAVSTQQQQQQQQQQPATQSMEQPSQINPVTPKQGRPLGARPKRRFPPRQQQQQPQAQPDPQQHKTHDKPIKCNFCHGSYHTERHCLARAKAQAKQPVAPIQPLQQDQVQPQFDQRPVLPQLHPSQQILQHQPSPQPQQQQQFQQYHMAPIAEQHYPSLCHFPAQPLQQQQQQFQQQQQHWEPLYPPPGFHQGM